MLSRGIPIDLLRDGRKQNRAQFHKRPNVVGTMLGVKLVDGVATDTASLIVAVDQKKPLSKLRTAERLPKFVVVKGVRVSVDVIEINRFVRQGFTRPLACSDGKSRATVSALGISAAGPVGLTCAHALQGPDSNSFTADRVSLWSPDLGKYLDVGESSMVVYSRGLGILGDFGFSDAGLFALETSVAAALVVDAKPLPIWATPAAGTFVVANSVHGPLSGQIHAVDADMFGGKCDLIVRTIGTGTYGGDSGLLWRTGTGAGVGIHAWGSDDGPSLGSTYSACMLLSRACRILDVKMVTS